MRRLTIIIALLVLAPMAAGCGSGGLPQPSPRVASVAYTETGGLAGMSNTLTISADGRATYSSKVAGRQTQKSGALSAQEMAALVDAFYKNSFFSLKDDYRPTRPVADGITTVVDYRDALRSKTVTTATGGADPDGLQAVLRELKSIITRLQ